MRDLVAAHVRGRRRAGRLGASAANGLSGWELVRGLVLVGGTAWFASIFRAAGEPWYVWPIFWLGYRTYVRWSVR